MESFGVWVGVGWVALETGSNGGVAQDVRVYSKGTNSTKKESYKKGIVQKRAEGAGRGSVGGLYRKEEQIRQRESLNETDQ